MRLQPWFPIVCALAGAGALQGQQKIGISLGVGGEWSAIPARVDQAGVAHGAWGGSATLELWSVEASWIALITRLEYAPERMAPAAPQMMTLGGGLRLAVLGMRHVRLRMSFELEGVRFGATAYNNVVDGCSPGYFCPGILLGYEEGWRIGMSLRPALQVWPTSVLGFQFTPGVRWLTPFDQGGPRYENPLYVTVGVGMVFKLRG